jgi:hypothetical protein
MADRVRLSTPRLRVSLADGGELDVQTCNPDLIRYERTAAKHRWPGMSDQPVTWMTFLAWSALRREAQISPEVTWERFSDEVCLAVETIADDDDEEAGQAGDPTPPGPDPG